MDNPQVTGGGHRVEQDKADWPGASNLDWTICGIH
jgi:hypothetical protein